MNDLILETRELTKEFKGFTAVDRVNLRVQRGHIHALIGPNGAGKTTCFNLLTKFLAPTRGSITFDGADITGEHPAEVARRGVIRSFQISAVFPHLSVLENVRIGLQRFTGTSFHFWRSLRGLQALDARALELLEMVDLRPMAALMLLDEPTQGMGHEDVERVTALIKRVAEGRTVLMVEHNMRVVSRIADRITVLARGAVLAEGDYAEVSRHPAVLEAYMGSEATELQGAH